MMRLAVCFALLGAPVFALCPDPSLEGTRYVATGSELIAPQSWDVSAGGDQLAPCGEWALSGVDAGDVAGYLPLAPTAVFDLSGMAPHILTVTARGACAPVLAVRSGDGQWHFGKTKDGHQEAVLWGTPDGPLQVWLGAATESGCDGTLTLETFDR